VAAGQDSLADGEPVGATPLDEDEAAGLRLSWVATRSDLNEAEQDNILRARRKQRWRRCGVLDLLDDKSVRDLHKDMFGTVWAWAGTYRTTEKSIGVDPTTIAVRVRDLVADAHAWLGPPRPLPEDQVAYELHHKLVQIHPFPNGNGRHARELTDLLLRSLGQPPFTWGTATGLTDEAIRRAYLAALRTADRGDYSALAAFVRS
jgi:Fic-DOC domain mobile mystery protein B